MASRSTFKHLIIGGGNSAGYAAHQFVEEGLAPGELCIISREKVLPYERPALSKGFLMKDEPLDPKAFSTCVGKKWDPQPPEWYEKNKIETMLGVNCAKFDAETKTATLEDGREISASDSVILATGARVIRLSMLPGEGLDGIYYLREYEDALKLHRILHKKGGAGKVLIVGGGYIGMEVAAAAATVGGCEITMVFPEDNLMPRLFTAEIAKFYEQEYRDKGIKLMNFGRVCKEFVDDGSGHVKAAAVCKQAHGDEVVPADVVVIGVGARPNTELFKDQLEMALGPTGKPDGVKVDSNFKTSADGVYAIGDIASFPYGGDYLRVEHVTHCRYSAAHCVKSIMQGSEVAGPYKHTPFFYSRIFGRSWQFWGESKNAESFVVGDFNPQLLACWVNNESKLVGIFMEQPTAQDTSAMERLVDLNPKVDVTRLRSCRSASAAMEILAATTA